MMDFLRNSSKTRHMHRLFIALRPPVSIRNQLLTMMQGVVGAKWLSDGQLHITLRYVGEVDRHQANDIAAILATLRAAPLRLAVTGMGVFDRKGQVDQLWAGISPKESITHLHKKIDQALVGIGLQPESRAFVPHITLARFNRAGPDVSAFAAHYAGLNSPEFTCNRFTLYESHLGKTAAYYEAIADYLLRD
jgi:RNA 2',3'-cyclic 3'-phosphodiesterase